MRKYSNCVILSVEGMAISLRALVIVFIGTTAVGGRGGGGIEVACTV
jgi:hypothetical protein